MSHVAARYLCDVGAGGKCIVEPILLRAYDDVDSSSDGGWQPPPPADWLSAKGEYRQYGMRYRLRRGVMGSAEPLAVADVASHPERDSWVGWYLQVCMCVGSVWSSLFVRVWFQGDGVLHRQGGSRPDNRLLHFAFLCVAFPPVLPSLLCVSLCNLVFFALLLPTCLHTLHVGPPP